MIALCDRQGARLVCLSEKRIVLDYWKEPLEEGVDLRLRVLEGHHEIEVDHDIEGRSNGSVRGIT